MMKNYGTSAHTAHIWAGILSAVTLAIAFTSLACAEQAKGKYLPVRIYVLVGQSNMQGKAGVGGLRDLVSNDPKKEFQSLVDDKGEWAKRGDVWIHFDSYPWGGLRHGPLEPGYGSSGDQIGPELGFGMVIGDATEEQVLLIKVAWGGKSLCHDFLSPSIGKYPKPVDPSDAGYYYQRLIDVVTEVIENIDTYFPDYKGQGVEIAGIGWHQGWNDQYGDGNPENYERNMAAFIKDIRSAEHGLGIANLPFVIATSGNIGGESPIKDGQRAMADTKKYPEFSGNVAVVDTDKPYGPDKMTFKFDKNGETKKVDYHWNYNAKSYMNIGRAMASEMLKLDQPKSPARFRAFGTKKGVQLIWQLGTEKPKGVEILRDGKQLDAKIAPTQTAFVDTSALPGSNSYELILDMPSGKVKFKDSCDTSVTNLSAYRSLEGVMLSWEARGKYDAFQITRDGKVIADNVAADVRSYEDKTVPAKGKFAYAVQPTTGKVTPATLDVSIGVADPGGAVVYEPFDYPTDANEPQSPLGNSGALGTKGEYFTLDKGTPKHLPKILAGSLSHGALPTGGNRAQGHRWSNGFGIDLDDSLKKAGLLEDGASMWISFLVHIHGGGTGARVTLQSADGKEGIGFAHKGVTNSFVIQNGTEKTHLFVKGVRSVGFSQFLIVVFLAKKDRFEFLQLMASGLSCQKYEGQKHDASMDTWFFG